MAKSVALNHTDSAVDGVSTLSLDLDILNYGTDFVVVQDEPGEVILSNLTSPVGKAEKIRMAYNVVKDVYKSADIDSSLQVVSKRGSKLFGQLTQVYTVTDDTDTTYEKAIPMEAHIVMTIPDDEIVTDAMVYDLLTRSISMFLETGVSTDTRLKALRRGALLPADV